MREEAAAHKGHAQSDDLRDHADHGGTDIEGHEENGKHRSDHCEDEGVQHGHPAAGSPIHTAIEQHAAQHEDQPDNHRQDRARQKNLYSIGTDAHTGTFDTVPGILPVQCQQDRSKHIDDHSNEDIGHHLEEDREILGIVLIHEGLFLIDIKFHLNTLIHGILNRRQRIGKGEALRDLHAYIAHIFIQVQAHHCHRIAVTQVTGLKKFMAQGFIIQAAQTVLVSFRDHQRVIHDLVVHGIQNFCVVIFQFHDLILLCQCPDEPLACFRVILVTDIKRQRGIREIQLFLGRPDHREADRQEHDKIHKTDKNLGAGYLEKEFKDLHILSSVSSIIPTGQKRP